MNKTRKELIEIINRQLLATKPPFLRNSVYFSVSEATDLLRELEDEATDIDDRKYSIKEIKEALLKQMHLMLFHNNGYPFMAVPKATILSLGQLMRGAPDLPQPPKTEK